MIQEFLTKRVGVRQELQRFVVDYLQNILLVKPGPEKDFKDNFSKSVALFQLMFIDGPIPAPSQPARLAITEAANSADSTCLFQQMSQED